MRTILIFGVLFFSMLNAIEVEKISEFSWSTSYSAYENDLMAYNHDYLFVSNSRSLQIFDVFPDSMSLHTDYNINGILGKISMYGDNLFISSHHPNKLFKIDVQDVNQPAIVDTVDYYSCHHHFIAGSYLFVLKCEIGGVWKIYVYDAETTIEITNYNVPRNESNIRKLNDELVAVCHDDSLLIYDISEPENMVFFGGRAFENPFAINAKLEVIQDSVLMRFDLGVLQFWNITDPTDWEFISEITSIYDYSSFTVDADNLTITGYEKIYYYNIQDITLPVLVEIIVEDEANKMNLNVVNRLFVIKSKGSIDYYKIEPDSLHFVEKEKTYGKLNFVELADEIAYIGTSNNGIVSWDISDLTDPDLIAVYADSTSQDACTATQDHLSTIEWFTVLPKCRIWQKDDIGDLTFVNSFDFPNLLSINNSGVFNFAETYFRKFEFDENGQLIELASIAIPYNCGDLHLAGNRAYLSTDYHIYLIENISSAENMFLAQDFLQQMHSVYHFNYLNDYIIMGEMFEGEMEIYRIEDDYEFDHVETVPENGACEFDEANNLLFIANSTCHLYDVSQLDENHVYSLINFTNWSQATGITAFSRNGNYYLFYLEETSASIYQYWPDTKADNIIAKPNLQLWNYPNPFNPSTTISFNINNEQNKQVELVVYNLKGQKVKDLSPNLCNPEFIEERGKNKYSVIWNGTDDSGKQVSSGIYFYKLKSGDSEKTKKMLLLK